MKIAVIGAGIAGMGAAYLLSQQHEVTLFEQQPRLGGHANSVNAANVTVDTGFIVYNERTYPNFWRFLAHLGVASEPSHMSFAVSVGQGAFEYSGNSLLSLFAQKRNMLRPSFWRMLADIVRFYKTAPALLSRADNPSLRDYLAEGRYSKLFWQGHLLPMGGAIWSSNIEVMLDFPAKSFVQFFINHGLFSLSDAGRPQWRTVSGGSKNYIKALQAQWRVQAHINAPVQKVERLAQEVRLTLADGTQQAFEQVVFACHSDEALALLANPSPAETAILGAIRYAPNIAYLHQDISFMPKRRSAWASWNYLADSLSHAPSLSLTYWMNKLQNLTTDAPLLVTLNPSRTPQKLLGQYAYTHPQFSAQAVAAQKQLGTIQGQQHSWFCGAWAGYGFHEDGLASACAVADALNCPRPWGNVAEMSNAYDHATKR